jgi:hypothetical protein
VIIRLGGNLRRIDGFKGFAVNSFDKFVVDEQTSPIPVSDVQNGSEGSTVASKIFRSGV